MATNYPCEITVTKEGHEVNPKSIMGVLMLAAGIRRLRIRFPRWAELVPPYAIGGLASFWMIQRVADL